MMGNGDDPKCYPEWIQVLRRTDMKKEASRIEMLTENIGDIKQMLKDQTKQTELVILQLDSKLQTVKLETKALKQTQEFMGQHVGAAYNKLVKAGKIDPSKWDPSKRSGKGPVSMQRTLNSMKAVLSMKSVVKRVMKK